MPPERPKTEAPEALRQLSIRAMIAAAARGARRRLPEYRLPTGHQDAKSAPRSLRSALVLAEDFCKGSPWKDDRFARKLALAQTAAENAALAARAVPKILAQLPTWSQEDRLVAARRFGELTSMTAAQCEAAYTAAWSVACTLMAVLLVTLNRYDPSETPGGDSYLNRIPGAIAEALAHAPPTEQDMLRLAELSIGCPFPALGNPIDMNDLGPIK